MPTLYIQTRHSVLYCEVMPPIHAQKIQFLASFGNNRLILHLPIQKEA